MIADDDTYINLPKMWSVLTEEKIFRRQVSQSVGRCLLLLFISHCNEMCEEFGAHPEFEGTNVYTDMTGEYSELKRLVFIS